MIENLLIARIVSGELMDRDSQDREYNQYKGDRWGVEDSPDEKLPKHLHVFMSCYTYEDYQGDGWLVGYDTDNEMFFTNSGSHCSCYGLEGQWDIDYYTFYELREVTKRIVDNDTGEIPYGDSQREHFKAKLELLKLMEGEA